MTVIVYRDGIMAADSGAFSASTKCSHANKIARGPDGSLYGVTGNSAEGETYLRWVRAGMEGEPPVIRRTKEADNEDAFHVLRVRPGCDPERLTGYGVETWEGASYAAMGSAADVALGALHAGATAEAAVLAAIEHSQWAHGPVRSLSHAAS